MTRVLFAGEDGGHVLVSEFRGMTLNGLFCADVLRPLDLVPSHDFIYKYHLAYDQCDSAPTYPAYTPIHEGLARLSCPVWPVLACRGGVITVRALCAVTLWTEMAAKRCGPMPLIASAVPVRDNSSFTVGDTVRVGCQPGYAPVPASAAVMSHSSRGWSRRGGDVDILSDSSDDESSAAAAASLTLTCLDDLSWSSPTHLCRSASVYTTLSYDDSILPSPPHTHTLRTTCCVRRG